MNQNTLLSRSPIRVGVVGLGRAGAQIHIEALRKHPDFHVTAVCDPLESRRCEQATLLGATPFASLDELVAADLCDVIAIATPSKDHYSDACKVLEAGVHCVLEKPMATNSREAREIVELANRKRLHLFVHHHYAYEGELLFLQEIIRSGRIGTVFHIDVFWTGFSRRWDWQTLRQNGGGALLNTCPHILTLLLALLGGDATLESGHARLIKDAGDTEDDVRMFLRGCNGITASATVSSACALPMPRLTLYGSCGTLQENFTTATIRSFDPAAVRSLQVLDAAAPIDGSLTETLPWKEEQVPVQPSSPGGTFYDNVAATLLQGAPFQVDPAQAARIIELLEDIASRSEA